MDFLKGLFPKLGCSIDGDPQGGGGAPQGQPDPSSGDNPPAGPPAQSDPTTEFVEFEGVKVPQSAFDKIAKERYKDQFDAYENRQRWQAENTRKAQELKQLERDAESFRRLQAERQNAQPRNNYEAQKQSYVVKKTKAFPEVDPRFFESQFDDIWEFSGLRAKESMTPILEQQMNEWEKVFLKEHPIIQPNSENYYKLSGLLEKGYDPEHAYAIVYSKEVEEEKFKSREKAAEQDRLRKLKASSPTSQDGEKPMTGTRSERIWRAMEKHGLSRE